jgi:hypothetical protein
MTCICTGEARRTVASRECPGMRRLRGPTRVAPCSSGSPSPSSRAQRWVGDGERRKRYVLCLNPKAASPDCVVDCHSMHDVWPIAVGASGQPQYIQKKANGNSKLLSAGLSTITQVASAPGSHVEPPRLNDGTQKGEARCHRSVNSMRKRLKRFRHAILMSSSH